MLGPYQTTLKPFPVREIRDPDVARTLLAGGLAVLTPNLFEEVCRRPERPSSFTGAVVDTESGDVTNPKGIPAYFCPLYVEDPYGVPTPSPHYI